MPPLTLHRCSFISIIGSLTYGGPLIYGTLSVTFAVSNVEKSSKFNSHDGADDTSGATVDSAINLRIPPNNVLDGSERVHPLLSVFK